MKIIKIILSILFLGCLFDMPYGYYQLVRFIGMIGFGILAYTIYQKNQPWFILWVSSAILINPFFKIALGKEIWNIVDVLFAIALIYSAFKKTKTLK
jgi:hypothetical protein